MRAPELLSARLALFGTAALCGSAVLTFSAAPSLPPEPQTVRISFSLLSAAADDAVGGADAVPVFSELAERQADCPAAYSGGTAGPEARRGFSENGAESERRADSSERQRNEDGALSEEISASTEEQPVLVDVPAGARRVRGRKLSARGGIRTEADIGTRRADGLISIQTADGVSRILLEPQKPVILISAEAAALMDGSRTVRIQLTIRADGSVPSEEIAAVPSALLPARVMAEVTAQVAQWRFSPAAFDGRAGFAYSIIKR